MSASLADLDVNADHSEVFHRPGGKLDYVVIFKSDLIKMSHEGEQQRRRVRNDVVVVGGL